MQFDVPLQVGAAALVEVELVVHRSVLIPLQSQLLLETSKCFLFFLGLLLHDLHLLKESSVIAFEGALIAVFVFDLRPQSPVLLLN